MHCIYYARPHRVGLYAMMVVVCLSVCASPIPDPKIENGRT